VGALTTIDTSVITYEVTEAAIEAKRAEYAALEATTPQGYEAVRLAIADARTTRVAIEKRRVELKAGALEFGRKVDVEAKRLTALIESIEQPLAAKKQAIDDEKARVKAEAESARLREIEERLKAERAAEEARLKAIRDAEEARLAEERARLEAERAALAEERAKAEAAARAEREAEDARQAVLAAERRKEEEAAAERRRAEQQEMDRQRAELDAKREAIEAADRARRAEDDARAKAEAERVAAAAAPVVAPPEVKPDAKRLTTTVYLHSGKEEMYEAGEGLGLSGEALKVFSFACYEVAVDLSVDPATGEAVIVAVDGRQLAEAI
jgi:colicin import membrane protein